MLVIKKVVFIPIWARVALFCNIYMYQVFYFFLLKELWNEIIYHYHHGGLCHRLWNKE